MSSEDDVKNYRLVYTCNCGWIDLGHADPSSRRPNEGAQDLWRQVRSQTGLQSKQPGAHGFKVTYRQGMAKTLLRGKPWSRVSSGVERDYFVQYGLTQGQQEAVALTIFLEVSMAFEGLQSSWPYSLTTDSGFSQEDLVSNLLGFYMAVRPSVNYLKLCKPINDRTNTNPSLRVWKNHGPVSATKNKQLSPVLYYDVPECRACERFPLEIQIPPAHKGSGLVRDWLKGPTHPVDELLEPPKAMSNVDALGNPLP